MLKKLFPTPERFYECQQESESEKNLNCLCHECLGKKISSWMLIYPKIKKKLLPQLKKYIKEMDQTATRTENCILCKSKKAALCPYCFAEEVFNMLKRNQIDRLAIMDFLYTFDFDLKHENYIHNTPSC